MYPLTVKKISPSFRSSSDFFGFREFGLRLPMT